MKARSLTTLSVLTLAAATSAQTFHDGTVAAGLYQPFQPVVQTEYFAMQTFMNADVSVGDYDGDGFDDIFTFQGTSQPNRLYHNQGDGTFVDVAKTFGLDFLCLGSTAVWADYDGNGTLDLFMQTFADLPPASINPDTPSGVPGPKGSGPAGGNGPAMGPVPVSDLPLTSDLADSGHEMQFARQRNYLYRNDGGTFTEVAKAAGLIAAGRYGAAFGDLDNDGDLDLWAVSHNNGTNNIYENKGDGSFRDRTPSVVANVSIRGFSPQIWDYDEDGLQDCSTSGDWKTSKLFRNLGSFQFANVTTAAGVGIDQNGMGACVGDFDNDGDFDWFVTAIWSDIELPGNTGELGNRLYQNNGDGTFDDITVDAGVDNGDWGWGAHMGDLDNDGLQDIVHTNGWMFPPFHNDRLRVFKNLDGTTFQESAASMGVTDVGNGRGLAMFDFDHDGDLDFISSNYDHGLTLHVNDGPTENWLEVRLVGGAGSHPLGAGAIVRMRPQPSKGLQLQTRRIAYESNYCSQSPAHAWFGAKAATTATIEVTWPSGQVVQYSGLATNQRVTLVEP
ncbi:MAG: CRTAC1 family protein [Planctomycetes bacterium]|nr:CRTAC1 family protein [Planctomycetota bacterium]